MVRCTPEQALIIGVLSRSEIAYLKAMEHVDGEDHIIRYHMGTGWAVPMSDIASTELLTALADEEGNRCGDMYIQYESELKEDENMVSIFTEPEHGEEYAYILGTDEEIRGLIPVLEEGEYLFVIQSQSSADMEAYRRLEREFHIKDAENAIENYGKDKDYLYEHINDLVGLFERRQDCNAPENGTWESAVIELERRSRGDF